MAGHSHDHDDRPASTRTRLLVAAVLAPFAVATLIGLVALWPAHRTFEIPAQFRTGQPLSTVAGTVRSVTEGPCSGGVTCTRVEVTLPDHSRTTIETTPGAGVVTVHPGNAVRLGVGTDGLTGRRIYFISDLARGRPMLVVLALFALIVVAVAGWRGLAALAGIALTLAVVVGFLLPSLLSGHSPMGTALAASGAILFVVLWLAHGLSVRTSTALAGTLSTLVVAALLGDAAVAATHLTGLTGDETTALQVYAGQISVTGLLLAGIVIGSLGVLNDITVTQASAVWELRAGGSDQVFRSAMRIGRDHIASTVYTLVLAYAGSALPVLLLFTISGRPLSDVLTGDVVAEEVIRSAAGGAALAIAVPVTTLLAVWLSGRDVEAPSRETLVVSL